MSARIIFAAVLLCSNVCLAADELSPLPDSAHQMNITGTSAPVPQDKGWYVVAGHDAYHVSITKLGKTKDATVVISMQDYKLPPPQPDEDFAALIKEEENKVSDPSRFTERVHDVTPSKLGEAVCARSHSVFLDKAAKTPSGEITQLLIEAYVLNCRLPGHPGVAVNVSYSLRYHDGDRDPQLEQAAAAILDGVQLASPQK